MVVMIVKELELEKEKHLDSVIYKLDKNEFLRFRIGPTLLGSKVRLFTNYPIQGEFFRETFYELKWKYSSVNDSTSYFSDVKVIVPGSYIFYYTTSEDESPSPNAAVGSGYFLVDPVLRCKGKVVPLDSVVCQTVLSKLLGPLEVWKDRLIVAKECGYNMIHFTPIQCLGASNSAYSLSNHLELNPLFSSSTHPATLDQVDNILSWLREENSILSIVDIVLNHTANETVWLAEEADATYNLVNSAHLRPAFLLDRAFARLGLDIGEGVWVDAGVPQGVVETSHQLEICQQLLLDKYLPRVQIEQLFQVDVEKLVEQFASLVNATPVEESTSSKTDHLKIIQNTEYRRFGCTVDLELALCLFNLNRSDAGSEDQRRALCVNSFRDTLTWLNKVKGEEVQTILRVGVENAFKGARYERIDPAGPRRQKCDAANEFVTPYFTCPSKESLESEMELLYTTEGGLCMAHNGWVMGDDPLRNFALPGSQVYLRRELVAWGDSVKLRYGDKPEDSPFIWEYMKKYTVQMATLFDGIRLDNCHSTPLHVASYMLDAGRKVNKDLYVVAELFTGSEEKDNIFVNKLGITSLIREGLSAWNSHELGRLVYKYGGKPVGAFSTSHGPQRLRGTVAHALFLDWTHDNPSPVEKRTIEDMLPSAGLVSMASCAVGSNRGYDELVPHHIHVVEESRSYSNLSRLDIESGMLVARREITKLHIRLAEEGYTEVYVDQLTKDVVAVTRHCPKTRKSVIMIGHTRFNHSSGETNKDVCLEVEGELDQVLLEAKMVKIDDNFIFEKHDIFINGCANWRAEVKIGNSDMIKLTQKVDEGKLKIDLSCLISGSFVVVAVNPIQEHRTALTGLEQLDYRKLETLIGQLDLNDIQFALYQCNEEGKECGYGVYGIPGYGDLNYCGLAGLFPLLRKVAEENDLGHPLAANLRSGNWLMEYISGRLKSRTGTAELGDWLEVGLGFVSKLPRYLVPRYFHSVISRVYRYLDDQSFSLMSPFVSKGSDLVKCLARGTPIHLSAVGSAPLPPLSAELVPPPLLPPPTLAAGLPHFSTGYMRSWGRDTFIALRGLLLTTGRFLEARDIILGYACTLRHGLIPNLLDGGRNARFNCRDAIWWWLRAVLDYIELKEGGEEILQLPVNRLFPSDIQDCPVEEKIQPLQDVINEALCKHWNGLEFREWNAGQKIDSQMQDAGFSNHIGTDHVTGFVTGGNTSNCGTWMDKMGSSAEAGNKGVPSTPRDGSAVEIVGLSYSCLDSLASLSAYPHQSIEGTDGAVTLEVWASKIKLHFEDYFWVGSKGGAKVEPNPHLVNCTGIYKDSVNSGHKFTDYQLRPNYMIALAVSPGLVDPAHAWQSLQVVASRLLGPLGLATLDPQDWAYRGDYDNGNGSGDPHIAQGANYHQGPEWVWPVGFFLRAYIKIAAKLGEQQLDDAKQYVYTVLSRHYQHLLSSYWLGLPELTNSCGQHCRDSNPIQAWSHSTLLDTLYDIEHNLF